MQSPPTTASFAAPTLAAPCPVTKPSATFTCTPKPAPASLTAPTIPAAAKVGASQPKLCPAAGCLASSTPAGQSSL